MTPMGKPTLDRTEEIGAAVRGIQKDAGGLLGVLAIGLPDKLDFQGEGAAAAVVAVMEQLGCGNWKTARRLTHPGFRLLRKVGMTTTADNFGHFVAIAGRTVGAAVRLQVDEGAMPEVNHETSRGWVTLEVRFDGKVAARLRAPAQSLDAAHELADFWQQELESIGLAPDRLEGKLSRWATLGRKAKEAAGTAARLAGDETTLKN